MKKTIKISYQMKSRSRACKKRKATLNKSVARSNTARKLWIILGAILILLVLIFIAIYLLFIPNSKLIAGHNLAKTDWLGFIGAYVAASATVCLGAVTCYQTQHYEQMDCRRREEERDREVRPIFSIELLENEEKTDKFTIQIENVGKYAIRNVAINNYFVFQLLKPNDKRIVTFSYSGSEGYRLLQSEYKQDEVSGYSKELSINYDDVDGTEWGQHFLLHDYGNDGDLQYSLNSTEEYGRVM